MRIAFVCNKPTGKTCSITLIKDGKTFDGCAVDFTWRKDLTNIVSNWVPDGFQIAGESQSALRPIANLVSAIDKIFSANKLHGCTPEKLMHELEKLTEEDEDGGKTNVACRQVVVFGSEVIGVEALNANTQLWSPASVDVVMEVAATDEDDAKSTIRGRMIKLLREDPTKGISVGTWFADGERVVLSPSAGEKPTFVQQKEYRL